MEMYSEIFSVPTGSLSYSHFLTLSFGVTFSGE